MLHVLRPFCSEWHAGFLAVGLLVLAPLHLALTEFSSSRICFCTLLITWIKQRLCLSPAGSFCPSSPMDCLGWKFPSDLLALPSDMGVCWGCPVTAHLALGFLITFLLLGQQLSCQWSYAGLPKTQPGCGFNCWLIPASQVLPCPLYLKIFPGKFRRKRLLLCASSLLVCTDNTMVYERDVFSY